MSNSDFARFTTHEKTKTLQPYLLQDKSKRGLKYVQHHYSVRFRAMLQNKSQDFLLSVLP